MSQPQTIGLIEVSFRGLDGYSFSDSISGRAMPQEYIAMLRQSAAPSGMNPQIPYEVRRTEMLDMLSDDAILSKRGMFGDSQCVPGKKRKPTDVFHSPSCCCGSSWTLAQHAYNCLHTKPDELMKHGFSSAIDPTSMTLPGMLERNNFKTMELAIEHLTDAQVGPFWDMLVPVLVRDPKAALTLTVSATRYAPAMAGLITTHGMPTVVKSKTELNRTTMELYGLSATIDVDMFTSELGKRHWMEQLYQISKGFALTQRYNAANALASCWNVSAQKPGVIPNMRPTVDQYYDTLATTWACLQNPAQTVYPTLSGRLDEQLNVQHADPKPKIMVVSPDAVRVLTRENSNTTKFDVNGPEGYRMLTEDDGQFRQIYSVNTAVIPVFRLPPDNFRHPFRHFAEIGEYVTCFDDTSVNQDYVAITRDRLVQTARSWEVLRFEDAIRRLPIWQEDGDIRLPNEIAFPGDAPSNKKSVWPYFWDILNNAPPTLRAPATIAEVLVRSAEFNETSMIDAAKFILAAQRDYTRAHGNTTLPPPTGDVGRMYATGAPGWFAALNTTIANGGIDGLLTQALATDYAKVAFTRENLIRLHNANVRVPINVVLARPHKRYITADVARMVIGEVAFRVSRPGVAAIVTNQDRTHSIIAEKYMGTAVIQAKNIAFARNAVVVARMNGGDNGEGLNPIPMTEAYNPTEMHFGGDAIYIPVPVTWRDVPRNLVLHGHLRYLTNMFSSTGGNTDDSRRHGYPSSDVIVALYSLEEKALRGDRIIPNMPGSEGVSHPPNVVCRMEPFYKCDETGKFNMPVEGAGFWKEWATMSHGAHAARCGGVFEPLSRSVNEQSIAVGR